MKKLLSLFLFATLIGSSMAQSTFFGSQIIVDTYAHDAQQVSSADFDGDGDMDLVAVMRDEHQVSWYENLDGLGNFGPEQIIQTVNFALSVFAADLDGDGDIDLVTGGAGLMQWHENTDGNGSFDSTFTVTTLANGAESVFAADLDGDNDLDLMSASSATDKIAWYENTDGNGTFGSQIVVSLSANYAESVWAADLDGDTDLDLLSASYLDDKVAWYENTDGMGTFGSQQIISSTQDGANDVFAGDFDGDNDMDVVVASFTDHTIAWFENTDGLGNFGPEQVLSTGTPVNPYTVYGGDLDNDGDMDIVAGWLYNVGWFENTDGLGNFSPVNVIDTTINDAHRVELADLNGDAFPEILTCVPGSDYVAYYQNLLCHSSKSIFLEVCYSYTVPSGDETYTTSGIYLDTIPNAALCDSMITINLTITTVDTVVTQSGGTLISMATSATYQWLDCNEGNSAISGAASSIYIPVATGNYAVEVTQNNCVDTSSCYTAIITGILENSFDQLNVFPNPTAGNLTIDLGSTNENVVVKVINVMGQIVVSKNFDATKMMNIEITEGPGLFYVNISSAEGKNAVLKVLKE